MRKLNAYKGHHHKSHPTIFVNDFYIIGWHLHHGPGQGLDQVGTHFVLGILVCPCIDECKDRSWRPFFFGSRKEKVSNSI